MKVSPELFQRAHLFAGTLANGDPPVPKNILRALTADFMVRPDLGRLRRLLDLLEEGSGGHAARGKGYGDQVQAAAREIRRVLDEGFTPEEYRSLFGWTARMLAVRATPEKTSSSSPPSPQQKKTRSPETQRKSLRQPDERSGRNPAKRDSALSSADPFRAISEKNQSALEALRSAIEKRGGDKDR